MINKKVKIIYFILIIMLFLSAIAVAVTLKNPFSISVASFGIFLLGILLQRLTILLRKKNCLLSICLLILITIIKVFAVTIIESFELLNVYFAADNIEKLISSISITVYMTVLLLTLLYELLLPIIYLIVKFFKSYKITITHR
ncbi:MAG: hypothetical protein E7370_06475 [Clostridiales bacterium]|nr:hypothetical protein [Clostridiales bacterium]